MKMFKQVLIALGELALAACGGGGGAAGTSPFGGGAATNTAAKSIDVLAGSLSVGSGDSVLITAIVKGDGNVSLANAAVTFATDSGNLTSASAKTDSAGVATATLSSGTNKDNRTITVTVTSGSAQGTVQVAITGTKLAYAGSTTVALGATVPVSVTATDSKGAAIAGMSIAVTSSLNNGLSATSVTTDALGVATLNYTATNPGADTLKFEGGGTSVSPTIRISAENFVFISPAANAKIPVGVANATAVTVRYLSNGAPQVGKTINFAATAGIVTPSSAVTNANGDATVSVYSNTASPATIQATLVGSSVAAQATLPVQFVALVPAKVVLQVAPTAGGPNLVGSTAQQADLIATVTDVNGNPVQDVTVNFNRIADPSGGKVFAVAHQASDGVGRAVQVVLRGFLGRIVLWQFGFHVFLGRKKARSGRALDRHEMWVSQSIGERVGLGPRVARLRFP